MDKRGATALMTKTGISFNQTIITNATGTRRVGRKMGRMIDHIFYSGFQERPESCKVDKSLDLSDHLPVQAKWSMKQLKAEKKKSKMNIKAILENAEEYKTNNRFSALMALDDTEIMAKELEVAVKESAEEYDEVGNRPANTTKILS